MPSGETELGRLLQDLMLGEGSDGAHRFDDRQLRDFAAYMALVVSPETLDQLSPETLTLVESFLVEVGGGQIATPEQTRAYFAGNQGYRGVMVAAADLLQSRAAQGSSGDTRAARDFLGLAADANVESSASSSSSSSSAAPRVAAGPGLAHQLRDLLRNSE